MQLELFAFELICCPASELYLPSEHLMLNINYSNKINGAKPVFISLFSLD